MAALWTVLRRILGIVLVVVGLLALVTPLTPGAWLAIVGLELLGWRLILPKPLRDFLRNLAPGLYDRTEARLQRLFPRTFRAHDAEPHHGDVTPHVPEGTSGGGPGAA